MTGFERGINPYTLGDLRHLASWGYKNGILKNTSGLLSTGERRLCREMGMVLPKPLRPEKASEEFKWRVYDTDGWVCRIGCNVDGDPALGIGIREGFRYVRRRPAYVVNGTFDVFHGFHWDLINKAVGLAEMNEGYVYILIESDQYMVDFKKPPIFDEVTRSGWFRNFGNKIDGVLIWDHIQQSKSWEHGYKFLSEMTDNANKEQIFFVLPSVSESLSNQESRALLKRYFQIKKAGFSVVDVSATYGDVSSSKLIKKFNLKPTT